ncbi:Proline-rich protein PRCC [Trinorchestia longiramus]|nr:Proline-rich protein PRCC [Trinorchestia longiramus]
MLQHMSLQSCTSHKAVLNTSHKAVLNTSHKAVLNTSHKAVLNTSHKAVLNTSHKAVLNTSHKSVLINNGVLNGRQSAAPKVQLSHSPSGGAGGGSNGNVARSDSGGVEASGGQSGKSETVLSKAQQMALSSSALGSLLLGKKKIGGKIQLHLPAMTEFAEEDDDEAAGGVADAGDSVKTRRGPSNAGTGLFSLLPKPKNATKGKEANRSLVPHILSKPAKKHVPSKRKIPQCVSLNDPKVAVAPEKKLISGLGVYETSDDEDEGASDGHSDFFSLETSNSITVAVDKVSLNTESFLISNELDEASARLSSSPASSVSITGPVSYPSSSCSYRSVDNYDVRLGQPMNAQMLATEDHKPLTNSASSLEAPNSQNQLDPSQMDDETWRRLTGKKRKAEDLSIIDFNPDDALLSRDELMNQVISQQKPNQSHSKKKGNLPSQQQKRKHQITYLAHQAKEREIELQNEWSTGKAKKMQTRAKYGF